MVSSWKNTKKKIKLRYRDNGYEMPTADECRNIDTVLRDLGVDYTMENMLAVCPKVCCRPPTLGDCLEVKKPEPTCTVFIDNDWCMYQEGNIPMNPFTTPKASANYNAPVAIAAVEQKTDTQTQREYLLDRWHDVERSYAYGNLRNKMRTAFNLDVDNTPKTTKELLDGITSGKYTIDAKKAELQEIAAANGGFENEDGSWTPSNDPLYAMNWGGLSPDRAGYETARDAFKGNLKAAKDTIMIGTPADGLAALQALEAWTPPAAQVANPN